MIFLYFFAECEYSLIIQYSLYKTERARVADLFEAFEGMGAATYRQDSQLPEDFATPQKWDVFVERPFVSVSRVELERGLQRRESLERSLDARRLFVVFEGILHPHATRGSFVRVTWEE